jgi:DNA-binding GntR family transcriptional regulator
MRTIDPLGDEGLNSAIYAELRERLVTGRMAPGHELSTRSLAQELGVSQTPVRDALSRLAADGALEIRAKRRVRVPAMTAARFDDLLRCRLLLEPEAAARALPHIDAARLQKLREVDAAIDVAIARGDDDAYMTNNHAFHFTLYRAQDGRTMTQLIETLWLQFGPFMRLVYTHLPTRIVNDRHQEAIAAVAAKDADALRAAIAADISEGMELVGKTGLVPDGAERSRD